jgi:hypothetical protein
MTQAHYHDVQSKMCVAYEYIANGRASRFTQSISIIPRCLKEVERMTKLTYDGWMDGWMDDSHANSFRWSTDITEAF